MTALGKRECLCNTGFSVRTVDGNQECVAVPEAENQLKCFHPINWKSIARTYRTETGVKDAIACQKLCSRENACTHFNYHTDSHDCELKIKNGSDVVQAENVITGPKTCNSSCYKVGMGHTAPEMAKPGKMYSAYDCQSWCLDTIGCHYFTFNVETSFCYLKGAEAAGTERKYSGDVAGPKEFCRGGTEEAETESGTAGGSGGGAAAPEAEKQLKCFHPINWKSIARTYRTETGVKDAIACQKLCSRENACTHFNYHTDSHDCELKIKNGSDVVQAENVITGPKTCNSSCYKVGVGHSARDMATPGKMYSAYDCQSWCLDTIGCHYFTFNVETSTCYLKGAEAAGTERSSPSDVVGPKEFCRGGTEEAETESGTAGGSGGGAAAPEAEKQLKCFHPINWKSIARTYRTETGVKDAIACQKLCSRENACTHFNYHTDSHDCELKIKNGSDVVQAENVITGPKTCNSSCYKVGMGHTAPEMAKPGKMYSAYDCQSWCLDTIGCHYFTFNVETSTCYLKGAEAAGTERKYSGDVAGPKEFCRGGTEEAETESGTAGGSGGGAAAPEAEKQLKCFHPINWKSIARTYRTETGVKDAIACQKLCSRENACTHFNYHTDSHDCELKIKNGSDVVQAENVITGPKTCNSSCYKVGVGHSARDMATPGKMYSAYDCQSWCLDTIGCHYFTFNVETSTCYLKGAEAAGTERSSPSDVVGPKEFCRGGTEEAETESGTAGGSEGGAAAPEAEKQLKCFHPINWKSIARTYRTETGVKDAIACQKLCSRENACTHFNYHTDSHDCELKIKNGSDVVQAENVITGPKTCNSSCYKVGMGHTAPDMAKPGQMYSAYDCQSWCLDTIGCHYFTFNVETSFCYLKGAEAAGTERKYSGDVVGPKEFCRGGTEEAETESGTAGGSGGGALQPGAGENPGAGEVENGGNSEEEDLDNGENTEEGLGSVEDTEGGDNDSAGSSENDITTFDEPVPTAPKVDFIDQAIIKVSARAAPSRTQVQISECFTVSFDRMEKTVTVASGSTSHSGKMAGAPSPTGGFVSLFYHDGQNLAVVYDYQLDSGDYGNVTVKVPFAECGLDTVNILKKSDDASFEGLRAFVTRDLKRSMTA
ncbi:unnamed protein product [Neospora caninum Liverpool]|uniref:PAN domain-containing protein n=1 Tax=Neospora caninum (strain Liverpool) TaxID=572307 RepID=F0VCD3_NEOCL|nr:uncharacterized protein NCLIV_038320 [Neospora caninum Liverpool]CBZ50757.1 unnamed protein product [Neospora caninum Liverpool]CEL68056.1 TPA: PAN domain-containing protein [Neospora caninum Liverpool]|eukprot:XP_003880790.1 uncharacterized protein NCLIV_038320 [Neospora caninum Liverpool]